MLVYKSYKDRRLRLSVGKTERGWEVDAYVEDEFIATLSGKIYETQAAALQAGIDASIQLVDGRSDE